MIERLRLGCRAAALNVVVAAFAVSAWAGTGHPDHDRIGSTPQSLAERQRLLAQGESGLALGDVDRARHAFEQAALMTHSADTELGILRTQMQAGEYRQALAFAAHTAGVHLDEVEGRVFYAWLLNLGGQVAVAEQTLKLAESQAPAHPMVKAVRQRFQAGPLAADDPALLAAPARLAPFATGASVSRDAQAVAAACLLADGLHALTWGSVLSHEGPIWLRNGLGQTVVAQIEQHDEALGLVLLKLASPLPVTADVVVPPRDAFPGSPAFVLDYPVDTRGTPSWPIMRAGFLGAPVPGAAIGTRRLGVALPGQGPRGGPVYDQGGRLIGLAGGSSALGAVDTADRLVPVSTLRHRFGERFGAQAEALRPVPVGADEIYERAMKSSLQVLVSVP